MLYLETEIRLRVQEVADKKKKVYNDFISGCISRGVSFDTARKMWQGNGKVQVSSLLVAANVLGVNVGDLIEED